MRDGIIEQIASPHEVFTRPANVFVASFIGTPQMNLLEAELEAMHGPSARVRMNGVAAEFGLAGSRAVRPGKVTIGIRPRALRPSETEAKASLSAVAELIEPMGAETLIHARAQSGQDIRVVVPRNVRVTIGERLHLIADPMQTHIFDAEGQAAR
jgi:multiple sugar transport system ATP-binding protein